MRKLVRIDSPGAIPEYSGTAMIATAMLRGVRSGWLELIFATEMAGL